MAVLVTGGAGFIGSHLVDRLLTEGHRVIVVDNFSTGDRANLRAAIGNPRLTVIEGDITDAGTVASLKAEFELIFHLAAAVGLFTVLNDRAGTIETNASGTANILHLAAEQSTPTVVFSTSEVYGRSAAQTLSEEDDLVVGPSGVGRWCYAVSKLVDEHLALAFHEERGVPALVVRPFNIVGPRQSAAYGMVLPRFARQAVRNEPITVFGDGTQTRTFCHVADFVDAVRRLSALRSSYGQVFNVGGEKPVSINDLAALVKRVADSRSPIRHIGYGDAYGEGRFQEIFHRRPNCAKLRQYIDFDPAFDLEAIVADVVRRQGADR